MASKNLPALPRTPSRDADADYSSQSPGFGPGDGIFFTPAAVADRSSDTAPADVSVSGELTRSFYNPMSFSNLVDAPHPLSKEGYARGTKEPAHGPLERGEMAKLKRSVSAQPRATARQSMPIFPTSHSNYTSIGGLAPPLVYDSVPTQLTAPAGRPQVAGEPARFSSNTSATDGPVSRAPASHVAVCNAPTHNAPMQNAPMHNSPLPSAPPSHPPTNPGPRISPPIAPSTAAGLALPCLIIEVCYPRIPACLLTSSSVTAAAGSIGPLGFRQSCSLPSLLRMRRTAQAPRCLVEAIYLARC